MASKAKSKNSTRRPTGAPETRSDNRGDSTGTSVPVTPRRAQSGRTVGLREGDPKGATFPASRRPRRNTTTQ
jgi:hypothetical protein